MENATMVLFSKPTGRDSRLVSVEVEGIVQQRPQLRLLLHLVVVHGVSLLELPHEHLQPEVLEHLIQEELEQQIQEEPEHLKQEVPAHLTQEQAENLTQEEQEHETREVHKNICNLHLVQGAVSSSFEENS